MSSEPGSDRQEKAFNAPESEFNRVLRPEGAGEIPAAELADCFGLAPAACNLGLLLELQQQLADAEAAYRRAQTRGDAGAPSNMGALLEKRRELIATELAYRRALKRRAMAPPQRTSRYGAKTAATLPPRRWEFAGRRDDATPSEWSISSHETGTRIVMTVTEKPNHDRQVDMAPTDATIQAETVARGPTGTQTAAHLGQRPGGQPMHRGRVRRSAFRLVGGICTLLIFAVPLAAFVYETFSRSVPRPAAAAASWRPTPPPIFFANRGNVGWALNGHKPTALDMEELVLTGAVTIIPKPTIPKPTPIPASLTGMPTTGWTLDTGAKITTDSHGVLVLRPLTNGRPSLPGQGKGWRGAYWLPPNTAHWENYTLRVRITNLGSEGSGGSATVVVGHTDKHVGYAVSVSAARITIQNQNGGRLFGGDIPAAASHRVDVTLAKQLRVAIDGSLIATFPTGKVQGGIGFGVYKPTASSNLPFFTNLWVGPH